METLKQILQVGHTQRNKEMKNWKHNLTSKGNFDVENQGNFDLETLELVDNYVDSGL